MQDTAVETTPGVNNLYHRGYADLKIHGIGGSKSSRGTQKRLRTLDLDP